MIFGYISKTFIFKEISQTISKLETQRLHADNKFKVLFIQFYMAKSLIFNGVKMLTKLNYIQVNFVKMFNEILEKLFIVEFTRKCKGYLLHSIQIASNI